MKHAKLVAESVVVLCPHCDTAQPSADGSHIWMADDFPKLTGSRKCVECGNFMMVQPAKIAGTFPSREP